MLILTDGNNRRRGKALARESDGRICGAAAGRHHWLFNLYFSAKSEALSDSRRKTQLGREMRIFDRPKMRTAQKDVASRRADGDDVVHTYNYTSQ